MKRVAIVLFAVVALAGCKKAESKKAPTVAPASAGMVRADGSRAVAIAVKKLGYEPDSIQAKPNEKLVLVFTRVEDTECGAQVKVGSGKLYDLPLNQPVEIAVTAPATGRVDFACGMDMMSGVVLVGS